MEDRIQNQKFSEIFMLDFQDNFEEGGHRRKIDRNAA